MTAQAGSLRKLSKGLFLTLGFLFTFFTSDKQLLAAEFNVGANDTVGLINSINSANSNSEADTINLATGSTYTLTSINNVTYSNNGLPVITSEIVINGYGSTIARNSTEKFRILSVTSQGNLTINNLTIRDGYNTDSGSNYGGGGILNLEGSVTLNYSNILNNEAESNGGGGIWQGGNNSSLNIENSKISDNKVGTSGSGAGLHKRGPGLTEIKNSKIVNNYSEHAGGAIYSGRFEGIVGGPINIENSEISNNFAKNYGGAIRNYSGNINIKNSHIVNNNTSTLTVNGGFLYIHDTSEGSVFIQNSCLSGNSYIALVNNGNHIDATQNWWGNPLGPNQLGADTVSGSGDVDYSSPLSSCPPLSSPSPSPNTPIVFLPGLGGSWNTSNIISGNSGGVWKKTPFIKVYDNLKNTFLNAGYTESDDYFEFYYDWRQPVDNIAGQLNNYINTKFGAGTKINLVGHSLGGLVSRTYAQRYGESKINQIVTAGSPHQGAIPAYLAWSGAQLKEGDNWESLGLGLYLHLHQGRFNSPVTAIQTLAPSLKDLLPIFDFTKNLSGEIIPVNSLHTANNFLNDLKTDLTPTLTDLMTNIAGNQQSGIKWVNLGNRSLADRLLNRWADGHPSSYDYTNDGDATVLAESALINNANQIQIANSHQDLVQTTTGIETILTALNLTAIPQTGNEQPARNPGLFFLLHSPAEITVTAPDGSQAGFNVVSPMPNAFYSPEDKLLLIYNAVSGNYQTEITGTGNGEYQLDIGQLTDNGEHWSSLVDEITLGETDDWTVNFNLQQPLEDPIIDDNGQDKINQAKLRLEQLKLQTKPKLRVYLNRITRLLNKNGVASLRLALTSTYKFRYWVNKFAQSDAYLKSEADQIGQLLTQALVTIGQNSYSLTKKQVQAELNAALKTKQQLKTKAAKVSGTNEILGSTLNLINLYSDRGQTNFNQNNFWQTHADALVVRVLAIEGNAFIR